jgi:hypothetical protein
MRKQYDYKINGAKVFTACNEITRFSIVSLARTGKGVWEQRGDIRDVISIGKLIRKNDGPKKSNKYLVSYGGRKNQLIYLGAACSNIPYAKF